METTDSSSSKMMTAPNIEEISIVQILYALSDVNRLKIVQVIHEAGGELPCGKFSEILGVSKPTVSHHFGILRESGVLATRTEGTHKMNALRRRELDRRFPGLLDSILNSLK